MRNRAALLSLVSLCCLLGSVVISFGQCASDEILVGEDDENYFCAKPSAARCVADKGRDLQREMDHCKAQGLQCARDQGIPEKEALCVAGLYFNVAAATKNPFNPALPYTISLAIVNCEIQQQLVLRAWEPCLDRMDRCRTDGLATHKNAVRMCLRR